MRRRVVPFLGLCNSSLGLEELFASVSAASTGTLVRNLLSLDEFILQALKLQFCHSFGDSIDLGALKNLRKDWEPSSVSPMSFVRAIASSGTHSSVLAAHSRAACR